MRIKHKLIAIFLAISLIPLIALSGLAVGIAQNSLQQTVGSNFETIAREKARTIEHILSAKIQEVRILATHPAFRNALAEANAVYKGRADDEIRHTITAIDKAWIDAKGHTNIAGQIRANPMSRFLAEYQAQNPKQYGELFLTDVRGANVAMTGMLSDYYQADESWWMGGYNDGRGDVFIDDRGYDETVEAIVAGVVAPVMDGERVIGILKVNFRVTDIIDVVSAGTSEAGLEVSLVRSQGSIIISDPQRPTDAPTEGEFQALEFERPGWALDVHTDHKTIMGYSPISSPIYARVLPGGARMGVSGEVWQPSVWSVFVGQPRDQAFSKINDLLRALMVIGGLIFTAVIAAAVWVARTISQPVEALHKGTTAVADGDLDYQLVIGAGDEIGDLGQAFNRMTERLKETLATRDELNRQIEERQEAEKALTRANRVHKAMSECSAALIQAQTEKELFSEICHVMVETGGYLMAWVGLSESDAEQSIRPVASYGIDDGYVESIRATCANTERGRGPVGTASRTGKPCVIQNYFNDPRFATWREAATKQGFSSTASFPLLDQGQPFGCINLYAGEPNAFDEDEAHLLENLTSNLSYGILALRQAKARKQIAEELLRTKEEAEKANAAKSEFLASMSHELRTPLNAVLGFAQMLQFDPNTPLSPSQNEHVENILAGGNHLLELVNEVLDLAKIEANQLDLFLEEVNANDVVADCVALTIPLGEQRDIIIIDKFSGGLLSLLRTDRLRFKQSLLNLLSNAVKYNKDGGTVTMNGQETDDGFLLVSVTDTGAGIAKEYHSSIFHMFNRLGTDPMIAQEGTGIGLTVTKLLVERMAGRVGFESEEGVGSTFWIKLPLASNENVLIWTDTMRVDIDAIDKDHQVIISLLNRVTHGAIDDETIDEVIKELIDYTHYHFRREEAIMGVCGDPNLEKHRDHHQSLAAQLNNVANNWRKDRDPNLLHKLREFLQDWVFNHVITVDTGISQYARGKDQEIRRALESLE